MIMTMKSPEQTKKLGEVLASFLQPGDLVILDGDLGAGKTIFTKGIGLGLGITEDLITSPTYTLINEYRGRYPLYHFDVYRLNEPAELEDLGYEDYFYSNGISIIEWGNLIKSYLPTDYLEIIFHKAAENERRLQFVSHGSRSAQLLAELTKVVPE